LHLDPRNSVGWMDLALLYTINGSLRKAEKTVEVALKLSPNNRFILRSAARFFAHSQDYERALKILRQSEALSTDPWLIAAEIGVSSMAELDPRTARIGRKILENAALPESSTTELASALGTMELLDGRQQKARRLFRVSLNGPTENSLAQAEWASTQVGDLGIDPARIVVPRNYEASALHGLSKGNWQLAVDNACKWWRDQPFSWRPAVVASYVWSTIFEEHEKSIEIIEASLVSNPRDRLLTNNLAFALVNLGRTDEAEEILKSLHPLDVDDNSSICLLATEGLLCFKKGLSEVGRLLYLEAIEKARLMKQERFEAMASLYLAKEEILANLPTKEESLKRATKLAEKLAEPDVRVLLDRVLAQST
jgi:tetratricopeptide (TPR) repeat protein